MTMRRPAASGLSRRSFLSSSALALGGIALGAGGARTVWGQTAAPAVITSDRMRPGVPSGVQSGDVSADRAVIWGRTDRPARLIVEYATTASFKDLQRVMGPAALPESDFSARVDLAGLPPGQDILYRVIFQDLADPKILSAPALGRFRTAPAGRRTVTFVWSGDEAGQGWGINTAWGGKNNAIKNVVWVTADVHYAQATYYSPSQAEFEDFLPFWEFVAGPINAGTFGPAELDLSFGPEIRYQSVTAGMKQNLPPTDGKQYFGEVRIDGTTEAMAVSLRDVKGDTLFRVSLDPEA